MRLHDDFRMPVFFKLWFAFVAFMAISIFGLLAWASYSLVSDPSIIGKIAGEVVSEFYEASK